MSQRNRSGEDSFPSADATIGDYLRLIVNSSRQVTLAGATDQSHCISEPTSPRVAAAGDMQSVLMRNGQGTRFMVASEAITCGNTVYAAAAGKIAASGSVPEGIALESSTADGDVIEVLPLNVLASLVGAILLNALSLEAGSAAAAGSTQADATALGSAAIGHTVSAADGTKGVKLPTAVAGDLKLVYNEHATNGLKVYPNTDDTINGGAADAAVTIEGKTLAIFWATSAVNWAAIFTANV